MTARRFIDPICGWAGGAVLLGLLLAAQTAHAGSVAPEAGVGLPRDVSADGWRIDWLIHTTSIFVIILFVIMCVWMIYATLRHNEGHTAEYDHGTSRHSIMVAAIISAVIFFIVDGNLFVNASIDLSKAFWDFPRAEANMNAVR